MRVLDPLRRLVRSSARKALPVLIAAGLCSLTVAAAHASTILWANDARGSAATLDQWNLDVATGTGTLITSFTAPNPAARGGRAGGIAILGSTIYYSVQNSGSVFVTNPSGADLGVAFTTGLPGISAITSDGTFLYLAGTGDNTLTEKVFQYTLAGTLVNTLTLVPTALGAPFNLGRTGLEVVGGNFVANQGNNEGPYNRFNGTGTLLTTQFLTPTDDFGFSGVAFDGTNYFAGDVEDDPSTFWVFNAAGAFQKRLTLTGCPGPNQLCDFQDLAVQFVPEPATLAMFVAFLAGFAFLRRTGRGGMTPLMPSD